MPRVTLAQTAFVAGELSPRVLGRTDMDRYAYGLKRCRNAHPVIHGGFKRRAGTQYLAEASTTAPTESILVPFVEGRDKAWMLEVGDNKVRVYNSDRTYAGVELVTPWAGDSLALLDWAQSDATLWFFHPSHPIQRLQRLGSGTWVIGAADFTQEPFAEVGFVIGASLTLSAASVGVGRTATASASTFLASDVGRAITYDAGIAVVTGFTDPTHVTVEITRAFPSTAVPAGVAEMDSSPQANCTPSAKDPVGTAITLTLDSNGWRTADVGAIVRINGGLCRITGYTSPLIVTAVILRELSATVAAPALSWSIEPSVWGGAYGYPRTGTIHQQRLVTAGNAKFPRTVWGSRIGEMLDYELGTLDSDAYAHTIDSDESTAITYVTAAAKDLSVLTESGEFSMRSGVEKPITPTNVRVTQESNHGCAQVRPVQINGETLFVQRAGRKVRAFGYRYDFDAYKSPDITALAEHITLSGITSMTYAQEAEQMAWASRVDGKFLSCTIDRDQQPSVVAWAQHDTAGHVECMASIPSGDREQVWMIVRRTVNGTALRYIECMDDTWQPWHPSVPDPVEIDRPVYGYTVDCGIVFDSSTGVDTFSVPHLAGNEVDIVADGSKMPRQTVPAGGAITLPRTAKRVLIGLPFTSYGTLLTPEIQTMAGSAQGQPARTGKTFIRFLATIGAKVQNNQENRETVPFRRFGSDVLDQPPIPFTGPMEISLLGWERGDSEVTVYQEDPMPMHVLAIYRQHSVNG